MFEFLIITESEKNTYISILYLNFISQHLISCRLIYGIL